MTTGNDTHAHGMSVSAVTPMRYSYSGTDRGEVTDRLLPIIPPRSRVLDVGCGTGSISEVLRDRLELDLIGLEPNAERSAAARARGLDVRTDILDANTIKDLGTFDVILFADVLEHLVDPIEVLRIAKTGLKPGGIVVVSVPNVAHWSIRLNLLRGKFDYESTGLMDATHLRWFTKSSIRRLFANAGFAEKSYTTTSGTLQDFYRKKLPWRLLPGRVRNVIVIYLASHLHQLFGFQHILAAEAARTGPGA